MVTTTQNFFGVNQESVKTMNYSNGIRTKKEIVQEFFGLRVEVIYDDEGVNVIDVVNEFKEKDILEKKKVKYNARLAELGVTEADFIGMFPKGLPTIETQVETLPPITNNETDNEGDNEGEQSKARKSRKAKA